MGIRLAHPVDPRPCVQGIPGNEHSCRGELSSMTLEKLITNLLTKNSQIQRSSIAVVLKEISMSCGLLPVKIGELISQDTMYLYGEV